MLRSSGSLGASAKVAFVFPCIFRGGAFSLTPSFKLSYHLLAENKYVNVKATPEIGGKGGVRVEILSSRQGNGNLLPYKLNDLPSSQRPFQITGKFCKQ